MKLAVTKGVKLSAQATEFYFTYTNFLNEIEHVMHLFCCLNQQIKSQYKEKVCVDNNNKSQAL